MSEAPLMVLVIERASPTPVFQQIYEALRQRIVSGRLAEGSRLPASRSFAAELGVSRATIVAAYEQLIAEGYAQSRPGAGVYVSDIGEVEVGCEQAPRPPPQEVPTPSSIPPRPFQPGLPDMRLFPYRQWARCVARVGRVCPETMILGSDSFGDQRLRVSIARHLAEWRGLNVSPEQILVTAGSGDALENCIRTLAQPGDYVALEDPGYLPLRRFVQSLGMRRLWLDVGSSGAELPSVRGKRQSPILTVLTPSHQFPLGGVMPTNRRTAFLKYAAENSCWIVEDDYDSEFRYAGRPVPALASFDQAGRSIYIGSFSKIFSDGLRLGFLVMPERLIPRFAATLATFGTRASIAPQRALAVFMEAGEFYRHIRRMRRVYSERRRAFISMLQSELGHIITFEDHQAGMKIVVTLPAGCTDTQVSAAAARSGITCPALSMYYARKQKGNGLLLGFCAFAPDEFEGPIKTLRKVVEAACN